MKFALFALQKETLKTMNIRGTTKKLNDVNNLVGELPMKKFVITDVLDNSCYGVDLSRVIWFYFDSRENPRLLLYLEGNTSQMRPDEQDLTFHGEDARKVFKSLAEYWGYEFFG